MQETQQPVAPRHLAQPSDPAPVTSVVLLGVEHAVAELLRLLGFPPMSL
jgi:hypothetical protein